MRDLARIRKDTRHSLPRFGLHDTDFSLPFILNLAVADLLYCATSLPLYSLQFFGKEWQLGGQVLCATVAAFRCYDRMKRDQLSDNDNIISLH